MSDIYKIIKEQVIENRETDILLLEFFKDADLKRKVVTSQATAKHYKALMTDLKKMDKLLSKEIKVYQGIEFSYEEELVKDVISVSLINPNDYMIEQTKEIMIADEFYFDGKTENGMMTILKFYI